MGREEREDGRLGRRQMNRRARCFLAGRSRLADHTPNATPAPTGLSSAKEVDILARKTVSSADAGALAGERRLIVAVIADSHLEIQSLRKLFLRSGRGVCRQRRACLRTAPQGGRPELWLVLPLLFARRRLLKGSAGLVPPVRADAVPRARLAPLQEVVQRSRVVLVSAPAGYGKSTLVAQWSELDPRASGWVQLAYGDNDPVALLARIAAALERTGPVRGDLLEELSRRTPRNVEVALPVLAADLDERDPFVLVLDDVHLVTAKRSRSILGFLAEQVPSGSQLVLVGRGDPGMRFGRLRASGDLVEVGAAVLALDTDETRAVAARGGLELSEEAAEALRERTEGWAAAVALAAISLRDRDDAAVRAAGLTGNQQQIADYLLEEVMERQPDDLTTFLLGTSILDRMTPPLCDAVLGTDDATDSLEALARSNAFVVQLDDRGGGTATTTCSVISSERSSTVAIRSCSPCT